MLKRRASLLRFLCILGQAGVLGELGELLTDQSDRHKVIFIEHVGAIFSNVLHFAVYTTNGSCMPFRRLWRLDTPLAIPMQYIASKSHYL